jgi:hypothetical protein
MYESIIEIILEFLKIPIGHPVESPDELVDTGILLSHNAFQSIGLNSQEVYFVRKSLKHICEKEYIAIDLFLLIPEILAGPVEIRRSHNKSRFVVIKNIEKIKIQPYAVILEKTEDTTAVIITVFKSTVKYLSNFELLWRTEGLDA